MVVAPDVVASPAVVADAVAPPVPELAVVGTLYLLVVDRGKARCEPWSVEPSAAGDGTGRLVTRWRDGDTASALTYDYRSAGDRLHLTNVSRDTTAGDGHADGSTMACQLERHVRRGADHLDVDGAAWFASARGCGGALEAGQRVATDFGWCSAARRGPSAAQRTRARAALLRRLRAGGALWSLREDVDGNGEPTGRLRCKAVTVRARRATGANVHGWLQRPLPAAPGRRGVERLGYDYDGGDWITFTGPDQRWTSDDGTAGGGSSLGCMHRAHVTVIDPDTIDVGSRWLLSRAACTTARSAELERRRWLPPPVGGMRDDRLAHADPLPGC